MKFAIIANPIAGLSSIDQKRLLLREVAGVLDANVYGLDSTSAEELTNLAVDLSKKCEVLVVAGGDGTFASVVNAIYPDKLSLAFLPLGTGNAIRRALAYRGDPVEIAHRIRAGNRHTYDLIHCDDGRLAFMVSLGIDGTAVKLWTQYRRRGYTGRKAYFLAALKAYTGTYKPGPAQLKIDDKSILVEKLMSLIVVKQPYFGLGMRVVPRARWDDGRLHALWISATRLQPALAVATAFTIGNRAGTYRTGKFIHIRAQRPLTLQFDGELGQEAHEFSFKVVPGVLGLTH